MSYLEEDKLRKFSSTDPVNNQYKAICSVSPNINTMPEHWVYVLKAAAAGGGGASWKQVAPTGFRPHIPDIRGGLCTNGLIYYLARIDHEYNYVLISFHVRSVEFKMIHEDDEMPCRYEYATLIEYEGKVTLLDHTNLRDSGMLNLWNVGDARNKKWSRKTLVLQPSQHHLVNNTRVWVKSTTQNGKILLISQEFPCYILCYDMQRNDMRKFEIKGVPDHWFTVDKDDICFDFMFMDQSESVMHLET